MIELNQSPLKMKHLKHLKQLITIVMVVFFSGCQNNPSPTKSNNFTKMDLGKIHLEKITSIKNIDVRMAFMYEFEIDSLIDTFDVVVITPRDLGFIGDSIITHQMIIRKASEQGLTTCPPRLAIKIAKNFDSLFKKEKFPKLAIILAVKPQVSKILKSARSNNVCIFPLLLREKNKSVQLRATTSSSDFDWGLNSCWVFIKK